MKYPFHLHYSFKENPLAATLSTVLTLTLLTIILAGCSANKLPLTPITLKATQNSFPGRFVWSDLLTGDLAASRIFYEELFGWTFEQQGDYTIIFNQGQPIAGMIEMKTDTPKTAYWIGYISVPDVAKAADTVLKNKGTILTGPDTMLNRGEYIAIKDPQGARLVLLHSVSGDPDQQVITNGSWLWHELWTNDINGSLSFYKNIFAYSAYPVPGGEQDSDKEDVPAGYQVLQKDDHWCAGITSLPFPEVIPQWVPAVRVVDLAAVISRVDKFGGRILITPSHPLSNGTVALIEDPDGAILMVEVWQPANDMEVSQ